MTMMGWYALLQHTLMTMMGWYALL
jgi:hypothetical protein